MSERRLPVYILLDCSESMIGESIEAVQKGVESLIRQLRADPHALETASVSIITYHGTARQVVPLTDVSEVQIPKLSVHPGTSLGAALKLLRECIVREVRKTTAHHKGDYRPIVFLLTDGQPTDQWESVLAAIETLTHPKIANLYAIGCGEDVDFDVLHQLSDIVFKLRDLTPESLKKLFIWLTASVQSASMGIGGADDISEGIDLSKKPREIERVEPGSEPSHDGTPRQVFLKIHCSQVRRPYLARFRYNEVVRLYEPVSAHPLESSLEEGSRFEVPSINASLLMGCPPCPYCQNNGGVGLCSCENLMCLASGPTRKALCPCCLTQVTFQQGGDDFSLNQSLG